MSQVKLGIASVLATLAGLVVCGIAASGASALEWELTEKACSGGTNVNFCYEKEKTGKLFEFKGTGEFEFLALLEEQHILFESVLGDAAIHIVCKAVAAEHTTEVKEGKEVLGPDGLILQPKPLLENTLFEFHLNLLECKLEGSIGERCKIPVNEVTKSIIGVFDELPAGSKPPFADDEILFKPKEGKVFIEFKFENNNFKNCPFAGVRPITGEVLCFIDKEEQEALEDLEEHELICDPARGGQAGKLFFVGPENPITLLLELEMFLLGIGADLWNISNEA
jgi:hypothetical protein